jgi:methoxymalonate biosynthesis acyl carrier protein
VLSHDRIRRFIVEDLGAPLESTMLTPDFPLIDTGVVDSLGIFQLAAFIEAETGVAIQDADLTYENLRDLDSIAALVERKRVATQIGLPSS